MYFSTYYHFAGSPFVRHHHMSGSLGSTSLLNLRNCFTILTRVAVWGGVHGTLVHASENASDPFVWDPLSPDEPVVVLVDPRLFVRANVKLLMARSNVQGLLVKFAPDDIPDGLRSVTAARSPKRIHGSPPPFRVASHQSGVYRASPRRLACRGRVLMEHHGQRACEHELHQADIARARV